MTLAPPSDEDVPMLEMAAHSSDAVAVDAAVLQPTLEDAVAAAVQVGENLSSDDFRLNMEDTPPTKSVSYVNGPMFSALTQVNGVMCRNYHRDTIRSVHARNEVGLRTSLKLDINPFSISTAEVTMSLQTRSANLFIGRVSFSLNDPRVVMEHGEDVADIKAAHDAPDQLFPSLSANRLSADVPAQQAAATLHMRVPRSIIKVTRTAFLHRTQFESDEARQVRDDTIALFNELETAELTAKNEWVQFTFHTPLDSIATSRWSEVIKQKPSDEPFKLLIGDALVSQLTLDKINLKDIPRGEKPVPATSVFQSADHRTVALMSALGDVLVNYAAKQEICGKIVLECKGLPVKGSEWLDKDAVKTYGIPADGRPTESIILVRFSKQLGMVVPDIGETCKLQLGVPQHAHDLPSITPEFRLRIAHGLREIIEDAARRGRNALDAARDANKGSGNSKGWVDPESADQHSEPEDLSEEEENYAFDQVFDPPVNAALRPYISPAVLSRIQEHLGAEEGELTPQSLEDKACTFHGHQLIQRSDESPEAHVERISSWIAGTGCTSFPPPGKVDEPFTATRIVIEGIASETLAFRVKHPRQKNWPAGFEAPPIKVDMKYLRLDGSLRHIINRAFPLMSAETDDAEFDTAKAQKDAVTYSGTMQLVLNQAMVEAEAKAFQRMNNTRIGSHTRVHRDWVPSFEKFHAEHIANLHEMFPGIATAASSTADESQRAVFDSLKSTKSANVAMTGCPGSGKTTMAVRIASAALSDVTRPRLGYIDSDDPENKQSRTNLIWTAPSHALVNDAVDRFPPTMERVRAHTYDAEMHSLIYPDKPDSELFKVPRNLGEAEQQLLRSLNADTEARRNGHRPANHELSLSNLARKRGEGTDDLKLIEEGRRLLEDGDTASFLQRRTAIKEAAHRLMQNVLKDADIVFGTPYAIYDNGNHFQKDG